jgi:alkanesulfonate monooxygenase SsuD/methylene tetrahydromethanopterin reductase-like flavin-dependent oxidoreductase (luciferase family)
MKIGIGLPNPIPGTPGRTLVEWAKRAEDRGFSTLATIDRLAYPSYESLIALAAAGAVTERIGLFTNILIAPARKTVLLAKESASVDQISNGRLTLGLAPGGREDDLSVVEEPYGDRGRRFDRQLEDLRKAWGGELIADCDKPVAPKPVRGSIPIIIGGASDRTIERLLKHGDGFTAGGAPPQVVGPFVERVRKAWKDAGRKGDPRLIALAYYSIGQEKRSAEYILDYYGFLGDTAKMIADNVPRNADAIRGTVKAFEETGIDELILDPTVADLDQVDGLADIVL